jgi:hypothetical protein
MAGTRNVQLIVTLSVTTRNRRPAKALNKKRAEIDPRLARARRQRSSHRPSYRECEYRETRSTLFVKLGDHSREEFFSLLAPLAGSLFSSGRPLSAPLYILHTSSGIPTECFAFSFDGAPPFSWSQPSRTMTNTTASRYSMVAKAATPESQNRTRWATWR